MRVDLRHLGGETFEFSYVIGNDGRVIRALNALHRPDEGTLVCHIDPTSYSLPHDLLRSLGKRSRAPGWPEHHESAWLQVEPWLLDREISDIFLFPADVVEEHDLDRLRHLAGERRLHLLHRSRGSTTRLPLSDLLMAISGNRKRRVRTKWLENQTLDFAWPENVLLGRSSALMKLSAVEFYEFDQLWLFAHERAMDLLSTGKGKGSTRWINLLITRADGSLCPASTAGVIAAFAMADVPLPKALDETIALEVSQAPAMNQASSPEVTAGAALELMGLSPQEGDLLLIRQFSMINGSLSLLGQPLPEHVDHAIKPQILNRLISGAQETEPLFSIGMNSDRRAAIKATTWLAELTTGPQRRQELRIDFKRALGLCALPGVQLMPQVRTLLRGDHKRGVGPDQISSRRAAGLQTTGIAEIKGERLRPTIEMLFSVEMAGNTPIVMQAQRSRNQAQAELQNYVDETEPRLAHLVAKHPALVAQANSA